MHMSKISFLSLVLGAGAFLLSGSAFAGPFDEARLSGNFSTKDSDQTTDGANEACFDFAELIEHQRCCGAAGKGRPGKERMVHDARGRTTPGLCRRAARANKTKSRVATKRPCGRTSC